MDSEKVSFFSLMVLCISFLFAEEILSQSRATWFSKDGTNLIYASFNTSSVGQVSFKLYGGDDLLTDPPLYGDTMSLRYPKVRIQF